MSIGYTLINFKNDILVETGSQVGKAISLAIKFGFKEIHSVEINPVFYDICKKKFAKKNNVHLYLGDSTDVLPEILKKITVKATFLLDAHLKSMIYKYKGKNICPILKEIDYILEHNKKHNLRHDILIDDRKYFNGHIDYFENIKEKDLVDKIKDFDDRYEIKYIGKRSNGLAATIKG
jgi:hypothetical protein